MDACKSPNTQLVQVSQSQISNGSQRLANNNRIDFGKLIEKLDDEILKNLAPSAALLFKLTANLIEASAVEKNLEFIRDSGTSLYHFLIASLNEDVSKFDPLCDLLAEIMESLGAAFVARNPLQVKRNLII